MAAKIIPVSGKNGEWEEIVFANVPVVAGGSTVVSLLDYELDFSMAGLGMALWLEYTKGGGGNTLTIGALWSTRGGTLFFPAVDGPSVAITASAVVKVCCPGTPDFRLTLSSAGAGTDHVTGILCGTLGPAGC